MKRFVGTVIAAVAALALVSQTADAASRKRHHHHHQQQQQPVYDHGPFDRYGVDEPYPPFHPSYLVYGHPKSDPRVNFGGLVAGAGTTAAFVTLNGGKFSSSFSTPRAHGLTTGSIFGLTTVGCIAVSPMIATVIADRELTYREAHALAADCLIPVVGGLLVHAAYDAHPEWEPVKAKPVRVARRARR